MPRPPELVVRGFDDFVAAAAECSRSGPGGEAALVRALDLLPIKRRALAVAFLGDARGPTGPPTLRRLLAVREGPHDVRCAAIIALAKRERERGADVFARSFGSRDAGVKACALLALAAYGDDRARPEVAGYLTRRLRRGAVGPAPDPTVLAVTYLLRYSDRNRLAAVATELRAAQLDADVATWLEKFWPACLDETVEPHRMPAPDASAMHEWVRGDPVFGPVKI